MEENQPAEIMKVDSDKLKLEKEFSEKLRLFLLYISHEVSAPLTYQIGAVIAYRQEDAIRKAKSDYPDMNIFYNGQSISVEEIIKMIYTEDGKIEMRKPPEAEEKPAPQIAQTMLGREQFIYGLLYAANKLIKDEEDKKNVITALKKL